MNRFHWAFVALLFASSLFVSFLAPPFQSPDEFDHVKRAYLLSKGQILLEPGIDEPSGGRVDSGLLAYMAAFKKFPLKPAAKLSKETIQEASDVRWSGKRSFVPAAGTGYYFPAVYLPQATALAIGQRLHFSVDASYKLTRLAALLAASVALIFAFRLYPPAPVVLALLVVPMTLFQLSAASLDGFSTALSILALSLFARIVLGQDRSNPRLFYALALTTFVVASSRAHLMPMVLLLFAAARYARVRRGYVISAVVTVSLVAWTLAAIKLTQAPKHIGASTSEVVSFYLADPAALLTVLWKTVSNDYLQRYYLRTFFGVLGWLDTPLADGSYWFLYVLTGTLLLLSLSPRALRGNWTARALLFTCCGASVLLVFLALLVQWTPHPATLVDGVQGRYFLVPAIIGCYALTLTPENVEGAARFRSAVAAAVLALLAFVSVWSSSTALVQRYYATDQSFEVVTEGSAATGQYFGELTAGRTFAQTFRAEEIYLSEIRLFLATFARGNSGSVVVSLVGEDGTALYETRIPARSVRDNQWQAVHTGGVTLQKGRTYSIRLRSLDGSPGNAITWWASKTDAYSKGNALVDSVPQECDFAFELSYLR